MVSAAEWQARVDLAACYRLIEHFGMSDLVYTHITLRIPDAPDRFLINPFGSLFGDVTASSLVTIDLDGAVIHPQGARVNQAGFIVHSAIHMKGDDAHCVLHTHSRAGMAVAFAGLIGVAVCERVSQRAGWPAHKAVCRAAKAAAESAAEGAAKKKEKKKKR